MDRQDIIARLRENERELRARGVTHAALFGSRARGYERASSDTDIMIKIDLDAPVGVYEYVQIKEYIASLFEGRVDVVDRRGLKPYNPIDRAAANFKKFSAKLESKKQRDFPRRISAV